MTYSKEQIELLISDEHYGEVGTNLAKQLLQAMEIVEVYEEAIDKCINLWAGRTGEMQDVELKMALEKAKHIRGEG